MEKYNHQIIEEKWREIWEKTKIYETTEDKAKKKFYNLVMYPYPSGDLHIGHWYNFSGGDFCARFMRMQGYNVLEPIGFDSFGLPAENAAIKRNIPPKKWTYSNIENMILQLKRMGSAYDWSKMVISSDPEYYKWTQWMFLNMYKHNLAYKKKVVANWCPSCNTVLANEQVVAGECERCDTPVIQKEIEQWLLKITKYADELISDLDKLDWPERTKTMQENWIGKSEGAIVKFPLVSSVTTSKTNGLGPDSSRCQNDENFIEVFTTRLDTIFGVTFMVLAPENSLVKKITTKEQVEEVKKYVEKTKKETELERMIQKKGKTGVFTGSFVINPANGEKIPIWISDYVLMNYGTGAIMAVPAHDERDFEFAKKFDIPIINVVQPTLASDCVLFGIKPAYFFDDLWKTEYDRLIQDKNIHLYKRTDEKIFTGKGVLISSGKFDSLTSEDAKEKIIEELAQSNLAEKKINYKLRDWLISRQRYWGAPIPIVYCEKCGEVPVPEKDLPVLLPEEVKMKSTGESPLKYEPDFYKTTCPKCGGEATRETDTMDTFMCSSWYFLRYLDPKNDKKFATEDKIKYWMPVDIYIGGAEHTVLHLLYSRFFTKVLRDTGYLNFDEPFIKLRHQGMILGPDGQKMSKSKGNVIDPDVEVDKYGADAVRMYLAFMGPYDQGGPWNPNGLVGVRRFLDKFYDLASKVEPNKNDLTQASSEHQLELERIVAKLVKKVTEDIKEMKFNTCVSALMETYNRLSSLEKVFPINSFNKTWKEQLVKVLLVMSPFVPYLTEELYNNFGFTESIHLESWPIYDKKLVEDVVVTIAVQINGKLRDQMVVNKGINEKEVLALAEKSTKVAKYLEKVEIVKVIYVQDKLLSIVTR